MTAFTDPLSLRSSTVWDKYREAVVIPHRYGDTSGALIQYDRERRVFVWADHPVAAVTEVQVNGRSVDGWIAYNDLDSTGRAVAFVEFTQPQDEGATVSAVGLGKLHPRTGVLMENPGHVIWDVIANVAGLSVAEVDFDDFVAECANLNMRAAGELTDSPSIQTAVAEIARSFGARFSPAQAGLCCIEPGGTLDARVAAAIEPPVSVSGETKTDSLKTVVVIAFDFRSGKPGGSLELEAPDAVERYGRRVLKIDAKWCRDSRTAYGVAERRLTHYARPVLFVEATGVTEALRPGVTVSVDHPWLPASGVARVLRAVPDYRAGTSAVSFELATDDAPAVRLVRQTAGGGPLDYPGLTLTSVDGERLLELDYEDGKPIADAKVVLNNEHERYTDSAGRVFFPVDQMPLGKHTLKIYPPNALAFTVTVEVQ